MQRILVLGAGFAGLWSALGAARAREEARRFGADADGIEILVLDRNPYHSIRVRNYESDLDGTCIGLDRLLDPVGVLHREGEVTAINLAARTVAYTAGGGPRSLAYDRLVFALGSQLARPPIPGLAEHGFDVDTFAAAQRLRAHIAGLRQRRDADGRFTALVVGAGLTGIEVATELPGRLRAMMPDGAAPRVILADRNPWIGSDMGDSARPVIDAALQALDVETRVGVTLARVDADGAIFADGERIATATVIWCAGMAAQGLAAGFPVAHDRLGRLPVDHFLRVQGVPGCFAAGDVAALPMEAGHVSVMSCQHGRPMGRYAGHNVVCDLLGRPMLRLDLPPYVTILDLGPWGAVYTEGWERRVVAQGQAAKRTKETINRVRIYPPLDGDPAAILAAAAPVVQAAPARVTVTSPAAPTPATPPAG